MENRTMVCICCPLGCSLTVSKEGGEYKVTGNTCKRGEAYGIAEVTNPTRVVTSTVKLNNAAMKRLPVRTDKPIPKGMMFECMKEINGVVVEGPVKSGEIIIENILGTGANLISSRTI